MIELDALIETSKYFKWKEAIYLPKWGVFAHPPDFSIENMVNASAKRMDLIREFFNVPITIQSWYRPHLYNELVGGAKNSAHLYGMAVDFMVEGMESKDVREILQHKLSEFNIRMEKLETPHVHIDLRVPISEDARYFTP